jgi:hypothetical protein
MRSLICGLWQRGIPPCEGGQGGFDDVIGRRRKNPPRPPSENAREAGHLRPALPRHGHQRPPWARTPSRVSRRCPSRSCPARVGVAAGHVEAGHLVQAAVGAVALLAGQGVALGRHHVGDGPGHLGADEAVLAAEAAAGRLHAGSRALSQLKLDQKANRRPPKVWGIKQGVGGRVVGLLAGEHA